MHSFKSDCQLLLVDFILFMESGPWLMDLVEMPMINRYTFDSIVRNIDKKKCIVSHNAIGPFQLTNPFVHDYLDVGKQKETLNILERLVSLNPKFSNIPVYQLQAVLGFIDKVGPINAKGKSIYQLPHDAHLVSRAFTNNNYPNYLISMYKRYYGAMPDEIEDRIERYVQEYTRSGKLFLEIYRAEESNDA